MFDIDRARQENWISSTNPKEFKSEHKADFVFLITTLQLWTTCVVCNEHGVAQSVVPFTHSSQRCFFFFFFFFLELFQKPTVGKSLKQCSKEFFVVVRGIRNVGLYGGSAMGCFIALVGWLFNGLDGLHFIYFFCFWPHLLPSRFQCWLQLSGCCWSKCSSVGNDADKRSRSLSMLACSFFC